MKNLLLITMLLGVGYSQLCDESNWQTYYPNMAGCDLEGADLSGAHLYGANLDGACLEDAIGFTQTNYGGTPILEGCAYGGECSFEDTDEDGFDDASYDAGADSVNVGDTNGDGAWNVMDVVQLVGCINANNCETEMGGSGG